MNAMLDFLVVEDDPMDAKNVRRILERSGVCGHLDTVHSLSQAKAKVRKRHYDAVILDLGLPDSQGIDGVIDFHASVPELPIVVLTGSQDEKAAMQSVDLGAEDFLSKNALNDETLTHSLRFAIERHRRKNQVYRDLDALRESLHSAKAEASTDPLTGLPNRRGLQHHMEQLALAHPRNPVIVGISDIDHFKRVNDQYGHQAGDTVLREYSARLQHCLRAADFAARIGGDEFVIVFSGLSRAEAVQLGRRIVRRVSETPAHEGGQDIPFSVTLALAEVEPPLLDLEQVLLKTHAVLARGKESGRDRVECEWELQGDGALPDSEPLDVVHEIPFDENRLVQLVREVRHVSTRGVLGYHLSFGLGPQPWPMITPAVTQARMAKRLDRMTLHCLRRAEQWIRQRGPGQALHLDIEADAVHADFCKEAAKIFPTEAERMDCVLFFHTDFPGQLGAVALSQIRLLRQMGFPLGARNIGDGATVLEHLYRLRPDWIRLDAPTTVGLARFKQKEEDLSFLLEMLKPLDAFLVAEEAEPDDAPILAKLGISAVYGRHLASLEESLSGGRSRSRR